MSSTPDQLVKDLNWRYATKQFDPNQKIPAQTWEALEQSLILSPSSFGLQPWKFLVIQNPAVRAALRPHAWGQSQITDASHLVVFLGKKEINGADIEEFIASTAATRGATPESLAGYKKVLDGFTQKLPADQHLPWNARQVYIALGTFMTAAAVLGIDTCPLEGMEPAKFDEVLKLGPTGYTTLVACAAGYRAATDKYATLPKVRYAKSRVLQYI